MGETIELMRMEEKKRSSPSQGKLQHKIDYYISNFSVHGLSRVFRSNRMESMFWLCMITTGVSVCLMMVHGLTVCLPLSVLKG